MRKTITILLLVLALFVPIFATAPIQQQQQSVTPSPTATPTPEPKGQIVQPFEPSPVNPDYKVALAIDADGTHVILVKFPASALETREKYEQGILYIVPRLIGCDLFPPDCKGKLDGFGRNKDGKVFAFMNTNRPFQILVFKLWAEDDTELGIVLQAAKVNIQ